MDALLYLLARALVAGIQAMPLPFVARLGRMFGGLAFLVDRRHRRVSLENLKRAFGSTLSELDQKALARENFLRLGENYLSAIKTAAMDNESLKPHLEWAGLENLGNEAEQQRAARVFAIGHFGNFELYARSALLLPGLCTATTYRGLRQPGLDRLMQSLRVRSGCLFFERRRDADALKKAMAGGGTILGLLADQHAGDNGLRIPFFGHECSTSAAPAVFALRYHCPLHSAICYRVGLARWRVELGPEIPTQMNGVRRSDEDIMRDVNTRFEAAVRRDPANWFWVHKRWKPRPVRSASKPSFEATS